VSVEIGEIRGKNHPIDISIPDVYYWGMIRSFRCHETEKIFHREFSRKFPWEIQERAFMRLNAIDAAERLEDLHLPPSNRLEALKGDRKGQYSIRVNQRWRICFIWRGGNAEQVEIVDYH
jgi:proteic killer suppression protein